MTKKKAMQAADGGAAITDTDATLGDATMPGGNGDAATATTQPAETKAAKFTRLAQRRMTDALKRIARVGNLASKSNYEYTPEQADKMVSALGDAIADVSRKFAGSDSKATGFTF